MAASARFVALFLLVGSIVAVPVNPEQKDVVPVAVVDNGAGVRPEAPYVQAAVNVPQVAGFVPSDDGGLVPAVVVATGLVPADEVSKVDPQEALESGEPVADGGVVLADAQDKTDLESAQTFWGGYGGYGGWGGHHYRRPYYGGWGGRGWGGGWGRGWGGGWGGGYGGGWGGGYGRGYGGWRWG